MKKNIGIFFIAAGVVGLLFYLTDPMEKIVYAQNQERIHTTKMLMTAIQKYIFENDGFLPEGIDSIKTELYYGISTNKSECKVNCPGVSVYGCTDISGDLVRKYIQEIPTDPLVEDNNFSGYYIAKTSDRIITVGSCYGKTASGDLIQIVK